MPVSLLARQGPARYCASDQYRFPGSMLIRYLYYINIIIIVKYSWKEKGNRFISNHPISRQTCLN